MPLRLAVRDIALFERPVRFIRPFRFGAVVVNAASQAFVRAEIEIEGGRACLGASAELMVPKWFDKRPDLSPEQTVAELRRSLEIARELYLAGSGFETAFGLHASRIAAQVEACAKENIPPLAAAYGPAEIDKAILDALLRCMDVNFFDGHGEQYRRRSMSGCRLILRTTTSRSLWRGAGGSSVSRSGIPSASMTGSRAPAASPIQAKMPAPAISSSNSTAIPMRMPRASPASEKNSPPLPHDSRHAGCQRAIC